MKPKLTITQQKVLNKMERGFWYCSFLLKCKITTMYALEKKGYLKNRNKNHPGAKKSPYFFIQFSKR